MSEDKGKLIVMKKGDERTEIYQNHRGKYEEDGWELADQTEADEYRKELHTDPDADRAGAVIKDVAADEQVEDQRLIMLNPNEIKTEDRQRTKVDRDALEELKLNIQQNGLIHAVCVREDFTLIAGGRRLQAVKELGWDRIPTNVLIGPIDELRLAVIELSENVVREDISLYDKVNAVRKIDRLQRERYKEKGDGKGWSMRDTAKATGQSLGATSEQIKVAEYMDAVPELKNVKTMAEAQKKIAMLEEQILREELAKRLEEEEASTPVEQQQKALVESYKIIPPPDGQPITKDNWKDCGFMKGVQDIDNNSIDFIDLDWPWDLDVGDLSLEKNITKQELRDYYKDVGCLPEGLEYPEFAVDVLKECFRVLKPSGWIIVWYAIDPWHDTTVKIMRDTGFLLRGLPCLWTKGEGQSKVPEVNFGHSYETFLYARKSKVGTLVKRGALDEFEYRRVPTSKKFHRAEKPVDLMVAVASCMVEQGTQWLVPFAGSYNTALAGADLGCRCIGFDIAEEHKNGFIQNVYSASPGHYAKRQREK